MLGTVGVVVDGRRLPVGGAREQAVLARLSIARGQVVARDALIADLWPDGPPEGGGTSAVAAYVYRLRKALARGGAEDLLRTRAPGYLLAIDADALDAARFEALARAAQRRDDPHERADGYAEALALWRGPAYQGLDDLPFAAAEADRLAEARLSAMEARIEADLACGRGRELVGELAALTAAHPLREGLWAARMTALYRAGRQAEALHAYRDLRATLDEELGLEPSVRLRDLEGAILRQDLAVPDPPASVAPRSAPPPTPRPRAEVPHAAPALALPGALAMHDSPFVRPEADMARLEAAWSAARSGRRQVVLLGGEPGIGKTRRCAELARAAHGTGATVLHGRCEEGLNLPYQPFVEALDWYVRTAERPVLGRLDGELARLVPELTLRHPELPDPLGADPETERHRLYDAVAAWLAALAIEAPTVLVVEDLHWASAPTLGMLAHLVRSGEPGRLLVVANHRDTAIDLTPALSAAIVDMVRQPDVERCSLAGLDRAGVEAFVATRMAEPPTDGERVIGLLHAETAGNPFYLGELVRHLDETAGLSDQIVPANVRDVVAQRLGRLPRDTRDVLALAAIQGDAFDAGVIARASGRAYVDVLRGLEPVLAARLVGESGTGYRFVHALVRHSVVDALGAATRMDLHRATGEAIAATVGEQWREHAADLARHALAATPPVGGGPDELARTLDYAEAAAARAAGALAHEEAAALLARALPLTLGLPDAARRARLLAALGEAQHRAGDAAHRATLRDAVAAALALGDGELAARAALANQRPVSVLADVDTEHVALLESILNALGAEPTPTRARVLAALGSGLHHGTDPRRHALVREALTVARALDDPLCLAHVLAVAGYALWQPDTLAERREIAEELAALAEPLGDPVVEIDAGLARWYAGAEAADFVRARAGLARAGALAAELGQPALRVRTLYAQQNCALLDGRAADFRRLSAQATHLGAMLGNRDARIIAQGDGAKLHLMLGRLDEATAGLAAFAEWRLPVWLTHPFLAWVHAESGRPEQARDLLAELGCPSPAGLPVAYPRLALLAALAAPCTALADRDLAAALYPELLPYREHVAIAQITALGPVAHFLGGLAAVLGRLDEAHDHFAFAVALAQRTGARGMSIRTHLQWAEVLAARGEHAAARESLTAALMLAEELDAPSLGQRAAELLARG
ncbi:MAG: BTAD domain-containing putative transcriptional regulator [Sporichthyaceae bacterium]